MLAYLTIYLCIGSLLAEGGYRASLRDGKPTSAGAWLLVALTWPGLIISLALTRKPDDPKR